jgi:hypothetical protein
LKRPRKARCVLYQRYRSTDYLFAFFLFFVVDPAPENLTHPKPAQ